MFDAIINRFHLSLEPAQTQSGETYLFTVQSSDPEGAAIDMRNKDIILQESRVIAKKPRDAAAACSGLKFADIHHKFKSIMPSSESHAIENVYLHTKGRQMIISFFFSILTAFVGAQFVMISEF